MFGTHWRDHFVAAEDVGFKIYPHTRVHLRPSDSDITFKLCIRRFPIKIALLLTIKTEIITAKDVDSMCGGSHI
jgi:hypothetical protein